MRARAIREGSVGLLILVGVALFGGLVLWLRGLSPGSRAYALQFEFENSTGIQVGTAVRYRGVPVGRVTALRADSNRVQVQAEITESGLRIPQAVKVEANQGGFIGETAIDITPLTTLTEADLALSPTAGDCDSTVILCSGDTLPGEVGVSYESLLRSADSLAEMFADPVLVESLKNTLINAEELTATMTTLTEELTTLALLAQEEVPPLALSAQRAMDTATEAGQEIQLTAADVRSLIAANRANVTGTLVAINRSSDRLVRILDTVGTVVDDGTLITNLERLSENAAVTAVNLRVASEDVRALTGTLNTPENRFLLQQTLESARSVFENAQKILADLDELTGDPVLRNNLRNLINGLSNLLSSTQTLEQQVELAQVLHHLSAAPAPVAIALPSTVPQSPRPTTLSYSRLQAQLEALSTLDPEPTPANTTP